MNFTQQTFLWYVVETNFFLYISQWKTIKLNIFLNNFEANLLGTIFFSFFPNIFCPPNGNQMDAPQMCQRIVFKSICVGFMLCYAR